MEINSLWFSNLHWDLKVIILNSVSSLQSLWTKINELVKAFYNQIKSFLKENYNFHEHNNIYKHCTVGIKHRLKMVDTFSFPEHTGAFGIFGCTFGIYSLVPDFEFKSAVFSTKKVSYIIKKYSSEFG